MNKKYIEKFSRDIVIDNNNLIDKCEFFIRDIEKNAEEYNEYIKIESDKFKELSKNNDKVIFTPENLLNISPITILDAPWGAGKTFFIESLCKYVINAEIKLKYIKKIIVIDSWKYSISNAIPTDFIFYLVENLAITLKLKDDIKNLFINFLNFTAISIVNKFIGTSFKIDNKKLEDLHIDDVINKLNNYIEEPILIIVDNIERIGENGWDILKTIQRLAMLNNLIFLLPMNKEKLVSEKLLNSEWKIEKYVNIPFYIFKQDYTGLLKKYDINDKLIGIFNNLLSTQIDGECLSIRELDKILSKENINKNFNNKYQGLIFFKEIWPLEDSIKKIITTDIELVLSKIEEIINYIDSFKDLFRSNGYYNIIELIKKHFEINIESPNILENREFLKKIKSDKKEIDHYCSCIYDIDKINFDDFINKQIDYKNNIEFEIEKNEKEIKKINEKIEKLNEKIKDYNLNNIEKTVSNNSKFNKWQGELEIQQKALAEWNSKNCALTNEVDTKTSNIEEICNLKNNFNNFRKIVNDKINTILQKFKEDISSNEDIFFLFDFFVENNYLWNDNQEFDIDSIYNYLMDEIKNSQ